MKRQKARQSEAHSNHHMNHRIGIMDDVQQEDIPMQPKILSRPKFRNTLEAQIQEGDTLQAIAIRYNCSVGDIKSLNKIERDFEIHARKTLKVPLTADTALIPPIPSVHKSGQGSPNHSDTPSTSFMLPDSYLNQKLMVAAVTAAQSTPISTGKFPIEPSINDIILNTQITSNTFTDNVPFADNEIEESAESQLLGGSTYEISQPHVISGRRSIKDAVFSGSGSDLDMSWVCLFICILALCFAIPLVYVVYIAEHPPVHNDVWNVTMPKNNTHFHLQNGILNSTMVA